MFDQRIAEFDYSILCQILTGGERYYTRRQINQDRMIFGDFSVNSEPIFLKFCKGHFLFKS